MTMLKQQTTNNNNNTTYDKKQKTHCSKNTHVYIIIFIYSTSTHIIEWPATRSTLQTSPPQQFAINAFFKNKSNLKPWQLHGFDIAAHHWFPGSGTAIQLDTHRRNKHYINIRKNSVQLRVCCMKKMHDIACILSWIFHSFPLIQMHQNKQSLLNREPNTPPGDHRIVPEELGQTAQGQGQVQVEASVGIFLGRGYCWCFVATYIL